MMRVMLSIDDHNSSARMKIEVVRACVRGLSRADTPLALRKIIR